MKWCASVLNNNIHISHILAFVLCCMHVQCVVISLTALCVCKVTVVCWCACVCACVCLFNNFSLFTLFFLNMVITTAIKFYMQLVTIVSYHFTF